MDQRAAAAVRRRTPTGLRRRVTAATGNRRTLLSHRPPARRTARRPRSARCRVRTPRDWRAGASALLRGSWSQAARSTTRTPAGRFLPSTGRPHTSCSSRSSCRASRQRAPRRSCVGMPNRRAASSGCPVTSPVPTVFMSSSSTEPSGPTSSEPKGWFPLPRASRASSRQRCKCAMSVWSIARR